MKIPAGEACFVLLASMFPLMVAVADECPDDPVPFLSTEHELLTCLTNNIEPRMRPARKVDDVVQVTFDISFLHIINLNEIDMMLTVDAWAVQSWIDPQLKWNPEAYDGLEEIRVPIDSIWIPKISVMNSAENIDDNPSVRDRLARVSYTGQVVWSPHLRIKAFCQFDMTHFPYDTQKCSLLFGSWVYDNRQLQVRLTKDASMAHVYDGKEWELYKYVAHNRNFSYEILDKSSKEPRTKSSELFSYIIYTMDLKRTSVFYHTILVAPPALLAIICTVIFLIPPDAGQRINLGIGVIISLTITTTIVDDFIPPGINGMPIIFMYLLFDFVMATFAILISVVVLNFHHRDPRHGKVPSWIRSLLLGKLRALFCLKSETYNALPSDFSGIEPSSGELPGGGELRFDNAGTEMTACKNSGSSASMEIVLSDIRTYLKSLTAQQRLQQETVLTHRQMIINEWQQLGAIIDRFCFLVYALITVFATIAIFNH